MTTLKTRSKKVRSFKLKIKSTRNDRNQTRNTRDAKILLKVSKRYQYQIEIETETTFSVLLRCGDNLNILPQNFQLL